MGDEVKAAAGRQCVWGLLACAFRYPDAEMTQTLSDPARRLELRSATGHLAERHSATRMRLLRHLRGAGRSSVETLQESYGRLFGHAVRGQCPPYELEYGRRDIVQQAPELADIVGFYTAFGLEIGAASHERADHVSVECEFMSVLAMKEAWAESVGDEAGLETIRSAQRAFLADHLGRWFPAFARRVAQADGRGFFGSLAAFGLDFIGDECEQCEAPRGSSHLQLAPAEIQEDAGISCGSRECGSGSAREELVPLRIDGT